MSEFGGFLFGNVNAEGQLEGGDEFWADEEIRQSLAILSGRTATLSLSRELVESIVSTPPSMEQPNDKESDLMDVDIGDELVEELTSPKKSVSFTGLFSLGKMQKYTRIKRVRLRTKPLHAKILSFAPDESELFEGIQPIFKWHERYSLSLSTFMAHFQQQQQQYSRHKKPSKVQASVLEAIKASADASHPVSTAPKPMDLHTMEWQIFNPVNLVSWEQNIIFDDTKYQFKPLPLVQLFSDARYPESGLPLSAPTTRPPSRTMSLSSNITVSAIASGTLTASQAAAMLHPMPMMRRPLGTASQATSPIGVSGGATSPISGAGMPIRNLASRIVNVDLEYGVWEDQVVLDEDSPHPVAPNAKLILNLNDPALIFEAIELDNRKLNRAEKLIAKRLKKLKTDTANNRVIINNYFKPIADKLNFSNDKFYSGTGDGKLPAHLMAKKSLQQLHSSRLSLQHSVPALKLLPPHFKTWLDKPELRQWHRPDLFFPLKDRFRIVPIKTKKLSSIISMGRSSQVIRKTKDLSLRDGSPAVIIEYSEQWPLVLQNVGMATFVYQYYRKRESSDDFFFAETEDVGFGIVLEPSDPSPFWMCGDVAPGQRMYVLSNNLFRAPLFRHQQYEGDFLAIRFTHKGKTMYSLRDMPPILVAGQVMPVMEVYAPHSRRLNTSSKHRVQVAAYRLIQKDPQGKRLRITRLLAAFPQYSEPSLKKWVKEYCEVVKGTGGLVWTLKADAPKLSEDDLRALVTPEHACLNESMLVGQQRLADLQLDSESLAPWTLSSNFVAATEGKIMLQVTPPSLPPSTGTSSEKTSIDTFLFFNFQRDQRESEYRGRGIRPRTSGEQLIQNKTKLAQAWRNLQSILGDHRPGRDVSQIPKDYLELEEEELGEDALSESTTTRKRLVITRQILINDQMVTQTEEVSDSHVISMYLRQQSAVAIRRKRRLQAYQASKAKKPKKLSLTTTEERPKVSKKPKPQRAPVDVRCGACGQLGHMRTNRECPLLKIEAPVRMQGGKLTISLDSLKKVEEERSKAIKGMTFKLPSRIVSAISSGHSTPPAEDSLTEIPPMKLSLSTHPKSKEPKKKTKKVPLWQFIQQSSDESLKADLAAFNDFCQRVLMDLRAQPDSWPFHKPVNKRQYPLYYRIVAKPIDLQTIGRACTQRKFVAVDDFLGKLRLMHTNCLQYNGVDHPFTAVAQRLVDRGEAIFKEQESTWMPWTQRFAELSPSSHQNDSADRIIKEQERIAE